MENKILAIKGHKTRGKEVIEILEMLGGKNKFNFRGNEDKWLVLNGNIQQTDFLFNEEGFTLEEFLEKYPYKVGDKVQYKGSTSCGSIYVIEKMLWENNQIKYIIYNPWRNIPKCTVTVTAEDLQPFKENENANQENETTQINLNHPCFDGYNKVELIIPDNWEFKELEGKIFGIRKQYPRTYEECSKILQTSCTRVSAPGYRECQISYFQELLICRDAYWKIAGEEMGLSGSWVPENPAKHYIFVIDNFGGMIRKNEVVSKTVNRILFFPTKEMRDAFFENFKDLIENCKEFL